MQQKIGGIAFKAEDARLDNLDLPETITIGEVKDILIVYTATQFLLKRTNI